MTDHKKPQTPTADSPKPVPRRPGHGSTLDALLKDPGVLEEFQTAAIKEVIRLANPAGHDRKEALEEQNGPAREYEPRLARSPARCQGRQCHIGNPATRCECAGPLDPTRPYLIGSVANFFCGRESPGTMNWLTWPAYRTVALDVIYLSHSTGPCGSCA
jgi:hypothetical protein